MSDFNVNEYYNGCDELKYVYDCKTGNYVVNDGHCCFYSPTSLNVDEVYIQSSDTGVVSVRDGEYLVCEGRGNASVSVIYLDKLTDEGDYREDILKVVVYKDKLPYKNKVRNSIVLPVDTVVHIGEVMKHGFCTHSTYCLLDSEEFKTYDTNKREGLIDKYFEYMNTLKSYRNILHQYKNNKDIIYHKNLDEYYNIEILKEQGHYKTKVSVNPSFEEDLKHEIHTMELEIKEFRRTHKGFN